MPTRQESIYGFGRFFDPFGRPRPRLFSVPCPATIRVDVVLPHPGMLPSGSSIASPECSRRHVGLSIDYTVSGAFRGVTQAGFPVRSASLLSRPDLALPQAAARSGGDWEERSHPEPRAARSFARAWRGWRAPDLPRSEHRAHSCRSRTGRRRIHCEA
jgi:hypothetical protein